MIAAVTIQDSSGKENIRTMQLIRPNKGIRGYIGDLNVSKLGFLFLSFIAE